jgi:adenine-specific DNA-methyltransferase
MIYIDPPYNTGSDGFVYEDDRNLPQKNYKTLIGVDAEKAKRILDFTQQKSNSHSAWLDISYILVYTYAKQLLKDEGVIFVSIDDNEVTQLRMLMDEVFGEENFWHLHNQFYSKRKRLWSYRKNARILHFLCKQTKQNRD